MPEITNWPEGKSRRDFLRYGAVGSTALIAGCIGGGGDGSGRSDQTFNVFDPTTGGTVPSNRHMNPWNPTQQGVWHPGANIFDPAVAHSPASNEGFGIIATDWTADGSTIEFTFSEDWTWHNGDDVTAHDWQLQFDIGLGLLAMQAEDGARPHPLVAGAEATGDYTIEVNFHSALSEKWALQNATTDLAGRESRGIFTKEGEEPWEGWRTALENEEEGIVEEITTATEPMLTEDTVGNGAFQVTEIGDTNILMEVYEDHPNADSIEVQEMSLDLFEGNNPVQPYRTGQVDAAHTQFPVPNDVQSQLPEGHTLFKETLSSNKLIAFNCGEGNDYGSPFEDRRVRQAVAHVFDRQQLTELLEGVNNIFDYPPCRVPGNVLQEGSHDAADWVDDFVKYGQNDTERATELLEEAGYSLEDGSWYNPDGNRFEIEWMNGIERQDHQLLQQNLNDFGIATNQIQVDDATLDERRTAGEYHVMPDGSSANGITAMWTLDLMPNWVQTITHYQPEVDVPMPVGDPEGSEGTKTINIEEHIRQWQVTGEAQYHKELMWWWNQFLPEMEAMYQPDAGAYNSTNWEIDAPDPVINGIDDALYIAPKMSDGTIRYVGDE